VIGDSEGESPETAVEQTVWNVLVATLYGDAARPLSAGSARCLRLALAAARRGEYQAQDLGGSGLMADVFDDYSRGLMVDALSAFPARPGRGTGAVGAMVHRSISVQADAGGARGAHRWHDAVPHRPAAGRVGGGCGNSVGALRKRAQEARQHVNPLVLQHGIEAIHGALTEAQIAKRDKEGKLKIRKFVMAKAALRPSKTLRQALAGAALPERLKAYNQQRYGTGVDSLDRDRD
jgi:hypothetical protein